MKQRTFYVVNLDRGRIMMLLVVLIGFVLIAFASGLRYGRSALPVSQAQGQAPQLGALQEQGAANGTMQASRPMDAPGSQTADLGNSSREIPRNPDEMDGLVRNSLRPPGGPAPADRHLKVPERRVAQPNTEPATTRTRPKDTRRAARRKRQARRARTANERRTKEAAQAPGKKTEQKTGSRHAPRTALRNVSHADRRNKAAPTKNQSPGLEPTAGRPAESYLLQMGTYRYASAAARQVNLLKKQGFPARVSRRGRIHKVLVGGRLDRKEVDDLRERLRKKKHAPIVVRVHSKR